MLDEKKASILGEGDKFGDYTVVKLLGAGGMGAVYLMQGASGTEFAVKIMFPDKMSHDMRRRFAKEAEFAIKIRHKNLVSVYDVGEDPETGLCYMIMDYMPGGTLADMLQRRGRIPLDEAVSIASQVAFGLEVAHRHGIVHRDVKPENILFTADGTPKLADLGVAKFDEGQKSMVTATGMVIGTPVYMAPEQMLNSHQIDARADIYSLGVVLYEMLSGKRPNEGRTAIELMTKAIKGEPLPDIRTMCPELSVVVAHVVSLLCAPKPQARPQTAFESAVLLRKAASGKFKLARKKPQSSTAEAAARRERRRRLLKVTAIVGGLVAFLFIGVAGWIKALNRQEAAAPLAESPATNALEQTIAVTNAAEAAAAATNVVASVPAVTPPQNETNLYCVIDLSGGPSASSYPVSYLDAVPKGGWSDEYKTTKLVLRRIEPGTFIMGEVQNDESHRVTITKPFYIGVFEVTQRQWKLVTGTDGTREHVRGDARPANDISPNMVCGATQAEVADSFIGRISARSGIDIGLPTEAQWEYACRAGTKSRFNNGGDGEEDMFAVGRFRNNQSLKPSKGLSEAERAYAWSHLRPDGKGGCQDRHTVVGMYQPNKWGLYDMHGNVWEMCRDWNDGHVFSTNPIGATNMPFIALRGGGFLRGAKRNEQDGDHLHQLYSSAVWKFGRDKNDDEKGFRVCASIGTMRLATSVAPSRSMSSSQPVSDVRKQEASRPKGKAKTHGVTDRRVRYAKAGSHKWYYTLENGEAVIWRGKSGYNNETRPAVDPSNDEEIIVPAELDGYKVKAIGTLAFFRCKALKSITIPEGVREIRGWGFLYCESLKSIHIPTSLKRIDSAFVYCQSLEMVDLRNCADVCANAFRWCPRLSKVTVAETNPAYVEIDGVLYTKDKETLVFFPNAPSSVSLPSFVKRIGKGAFCSSEKLTSVLIPTNVIEINDSAFSCCWNLADVRIEHGLRTVGNSAFSSCSKLRNIWFPASLERIGDSLFNNSMNLERVTFYGNAPAFNDSRQNSLLGKTSPHLVIAVKHGTKGWKAPGSTELPEVWPVEGFDDSRPIKFLDTLGTAEDSPHAQIAPPVKLVPTAKTSPKGEKIEAVPNNGVNNLGKRNNQGNMNDGFPFISYRFDRNFQKDSANLKGQVSQLIQELNRTMGGTFAALMREKNAKITICFEDKSSVKEYSSDSSKGVLRVSSRNLRSRPGHALYYLAQELMMIALYGERHKEFHARGHVTRIICEHTSADALFASTHSSYGSYSSSLSSLKKALEVDPNMDIYDFDGNPMGKRRPKDLMSPYGMREAKVLWLIQELAKKHKDVMPAFWKAWQAEKANLADSMSLDDLIALFSIATNENLLGWLSEHGFTKRLLYTRVATPAQFKERK